MLQFPAIPSWDALHPLIIHFPIALLLVAPIFIVVGAVLTPARGRSYLIAAMVLLLVGTASIFVAVESGEAAGKLAERTPGMQLVDCRKVTITSCYASKLVWRQTAKCPSPATNGRNSTALLSRVPCQPATSFAPSSS